MLEKLKSLLADETIYISLVIIFVAVGSFGLGRFSVTSEKEHKNKTQEVEFVLTEPRSDEYTNELKNPQNFLVASKSGTRFHLLTCPGASQIKESNKIFFSSFEAAEAAGFTPAANCKF